MLERGVLADYTELWVQNAQSTSQVLRFHGADYHGVLVSCGAMGVLAVGRQDKPASRPLVAALAAGQIPDGIGVLFDGLHALCDIDGNTVIASSATDPRTEGMPVLSINEDGVTWHAKQFESMEKRVKMFWSQH
ncbi:hypothetical protein [Roseobacter cerasinus]|nr:hypothetical protein [Roseobacter cerasinus]